MRASQWLLGFATTSAIFGAVAAGCGGSSGGGGGGGHDASTTDVVSEPAPEAAAEASKESGPQDAAPEACVPVDANLNNLPVPDASLGDSGVSLAACVSCLKTNCSSEITACNADCVCLDTIVGCIAGGAISVSCVGSAALSNPAIQGLGLCVETWCASECTGGKLGEGGAGEGGGEGGAGEAGDAAGGG